MFCLSVVNDWDLIKVCQTILRHFGKNAQHYHWKRVSCCNQYCKNIFKILQTLLKGRFRVTLRAECSISWRNRAFPLKHNAAFTELRAGSDPASALGASGSFCWAHAATRTRWGTHHLLREPSKDRPPRFSTSSGRETQQVAAGNPEACPAHKQANWVWGVFVRGSCIKQTLLTFVHWLQTQMCCHSRGIGRRETAAASKPLRFI